MNNLVNLAKVLEGTTGIHTPRVTSKKQTNKNWSSSNVLLSLSNLEWLVGLPPHHLLPPPWANALIYYYY